MADPENSKPPRLKKGIDAKIVKYAHRRRFQEYVRTKGRDKSTIAYVYWSMFLRSGKGNVFELEESLFLGDLGIGKNALRPARKTLVDDGWLTKDQQKIDPLTGKWGTTAWTVNIERVVHSEGIGTVAPLTGDCSADVGSTGDRSEGDTVVLHSLDADASTSTEATSPETKKPIKEAVLAPLAPIVVENQDQNLSGLNSEEPEDKTNTNPDWESWREHPGIKELENVWRRRTGYRFETRDIVTAYALITAHGVPLVNAVLWDTLYNETRKSSKLRWNNFQVFARNWDRNFEEYMSSRRTDPKRKFVVCSYATQSQKNGDWKKACAWLKQYGKEGEWSLSGAEVREFVDRGIGYEHMIAAINFLKDSTLTASKEWFVELMHEAANIVPEK